MGAGRLDSTRVTVGAAHARHGQPGKKTRWRSMELCGGMLGVPGLTTAEPVETLESVLKSYIAGKADQGRARGNTQGAGKRRLRGCFPCRLARRAVGPGEPIRTDSSKKNVRCACLVPAFVV